ncbi:hypothetical protein T05_7879 [Trichinella murrelli]|uniref:Uncharacterized protein n=1 Tax=Trichinella murrelli TaxID=144512 RepID=A0A0V0UAD3_9BILA|nr:hypothetical protein T05_7879 [Trichinella murrelli]
MATSSFRQLRKRQFRQFAQQRIIAQCRGERVFIVNSLQFTLAHKSTALILEQWRSKLLNVILQQQALDESYHNLLIHLGCQRSGVGIRSAIHQGLCHQPFHRPEVFQSPLADPRYQ